MFRKWQICCTICALIFCVCGILVWMTNENKVLAICLFGISLVFLAVPDLVKYHKRRCINLLDFLWSDNITEEALMRLAKSIYWRVRRNVTFHPKVTENILDKLSRDRHWLVCFGVIENTKTSEAALYRMSKHKDREVRMNVLRNAKTSDACVAELCNDKDPAVREEAKKELARRREAKKEEV